MTIPELAKELNITPQTIYARIKQEGINLAALKTDSNSADLNQDGINLIIKWYSKIDSNENDINQDKPAETKESAVESELKSLKIQIKMLEDQIEGLKNERDYLRKLLEEERKALETEREVNRQLLLPAPASQDQQQRKKKHWWQRG